MSATVIKTTTTLPKGEYRTNSPSYTVTIHLSTTAIAAKASEVVSISASSIEPVRMVYNARESAIRELIRKINSK